MCRGVRDFERRAITGHCELHRGTLTIINHLRPEMPEDGVHQPVTDRICVPPIELRCDDSDCRSECAVRERREPEILGKLVCRTPDHRLDEVGVFGCRTEPVAPGVGTTIGLEALPESASDET